MKPLSLLLLRLSTGLLLLIWAIVRLGATEEAIGVSDKYYGGLLSNETLQYVLGTGQTLLALCVILGLLRSIAYPAQFISLALGAAAIWPSLVDPLGLIFGREAVNILFFPSLCVVSATVALMAFKDEDKWALDVKFFGSRS
jgi:hypothetical protein